MGERTITGAGRRAITIICSRPHRAEVRRVMKMEWMHAGDSTPACWACFMIFDDHAEVLAVIGANERIDGRMTLTAARKLWSDLKQRGWYRATDEEITHHQMSHRALRRIAYGRG